MADKKISELTAASLPLAGSEVLPVVQSSTNKKVSVDDLTVKNIRSNATTGLLQVAGPSAGATRVATTPDANFTVARTDAAQSFTGDQTLATGNLVVGTAGKGIDFSANTHAAGMTSELLNDYEEGTFTPVLSSSATPPTVASYTTQYGSYTKIGNRVFVTVNILANVTNAGTGFPVITGLPYAANANCLNGPTWGLATLLNLAINGNFVSGTTVQMAFSSYNIANDYCCFSIMYEV
jgi:hypothetical protein